MVMACTVIVLDFLGKVHAAEEDLFSPCMTIDQPWQGMGTNNTQNQNYRDNRLRAILNLNQSSDVIFSQARHSIWDAGPQAAASENISCSLWPCVWESSESARGSSMTVLECLSRGSRTKRTLKSTKNVMMLSPKICSISAAHLTSCQRACAAHSPCQAVSKMEGKEFGGSLDCYSCKLTIWIMRAQWPLEWVTAL